MSSFEDTPAGFRASLTQNEINAQIRLNDSICKNKPSKWRLVDNREAYIKKRMALEGLK